MRHLLLALFGVGVFAPGWTFADAINYEVRGKKVRLEVDPDHLLVRPQKDVTADAAAIAAVRAQSDLAKTAAAPYLKQLKVEPAIEILPLKAALVPCVAGMDDADIGNLATAAADELRSAERVYRFSGRVVVPTGTISVRFKAAADKDIADGLKMKELERPRYARHVVRLQPMERGADVFAEAAKLRERDDVVWAEPDLVCHIRLLGGDQVQPNDPYFKHQWYLPSIHAPEAWALGVGTDKFTVAVLDDGVDQHHEDLKDKLVKGHDFYKDDDDPQPDEKGAHGTCCAGIIGAATDNGIGTAGIAWNCKIMPIRISSSQGFATDEAIAKAFLFAQENGARIMSCSWGGGAPTNKLMDAIDTVVDAGCLVIVAAGNALPAQNVMFPASHPKGLAVGALRHDDTRWDYSCYGPENQVSLVAPSGDVNLRGDI
jgi:subtilisin family serine protease